MKAARRSRYSDPRNGRLSDLGASRVYFSFSIQKRDGGNELLGVKNRQKSTNNVSSEIIAKTIILQAIILEEGK